MRKIKQGNVIGVLSTAAQYRVIFRVHGEQTCLLPFLAVRGLVIAKLVMFRLTVPHRYQYFTFHLMLSSVWVSGFGMDCEPGFRMNRRLKALACVRLHIQ